MNRKVRFFPPLILTVAVGLIGLIWLLGREPRKDVGYYFPGWVGPSVSAADLDARFRELTSSSDCVKMMFQGSRVEPTMAGLIWGRILDILPASLAGHLPQYAYPDSGRARKWLFDHATNAAVSAALEREWPEADEWLRAAWFTSVPVAAVRSRSRSVYARLALATPESASFNERVAAARMLVSSDPFGAAEANFVAQVLVAAGSIPRATDLNANQLIADVARFDRAQPAVVAALAKLATNKQFLAGPATLALVSLEPAELSHRSRLGAALSDLNRRQFRAHGSLSEMLTWSEFQPVLASEWGLGLLAEQLVVSSKTNQVAGTNQIRFSGPDDLWLRVVDALGTNASALSGRLLDLILREPEAPKARLAVTFANVAVHTRENLEAVIPLLSDHETVAPLLLWLGAAGSAAEHAQSAVRAIANDTKFYPPEAGSREIAFQLDPVLARRYGLVPQQRGRKDAKGDGKGSKRPSQISIPTEACPMRWAGDWPGARTRTPPSFPTMSARMRAQSRTQSPDLRQASRTTLQQLAQGCLRRISGVPSGNGAGADGANEIADGAKDAHQ